MDLSRMVRYWIGWLTIARLHLFRAVDAIEATTTAIEYLKIRVIVCDDPDYLLES